MKRENNIQTYAQAFIFRGKASLLQARRGIANASDKRIGRFPLAGNLSDGTIVAASKTLLWTESAPGERFLLAGKVHNLRLAVKKINGLEIPAGAIFSFWKHLGRANKVKGYVAGRELREGCLVPSVGGGLCQLSNALYDAALKAGFEIVERHAHSQIVAGSLAEQGRDATVFWNYIDLRFKSAADFRIAAKLDANYLTVEFKSAVKNAKLFQIARNDEFENPKSKIQKTNSCASCGAGDCFRSLKAEANLDFGRTAFLVDEFSAEFDEYLQKMRTAKDVLFVPLDGARFRKANYAWNCRGFNNIRQSFLVALERSYKSRKLAAQGASRQLNLLAMSRKLAESYAGHLKYDVTHLVVQQNLLPFLWRSGILGGRSFDVLMTGLPIEKLQETLNFAAALHPKSVTLGDFRADDNLIEAETEALQNAGKIITPHSAVAALYPDRAALLDWKTPPARKIVKRPNEKFTVVFPASTVGRKGCYELREAIKDSDIKLIVLGAELEGADFWRGVDWEKGGDDWLERADLVALPAFVEHKPRRLLQAVANRIPVVASTACGLENVAGVENIKAGNIEQLRDEIKRKRMQWSNYAAR
ncbi:MAG: VanW family protein [Pyrinomonadaceae bacterium]|nr:VanW family protein [Pyrinomonadaceae bacterium]